MENIFKSLLLRIEVKRPKKQIQGWIMVGYDMKTILPKELKDYEKLGWKFVRKKYFLTTKISDWWKSLAPSEKNNFYLTTLGGIILIIASLILSV
ncbi:MAG: hypothetical protein JXR05_13695 [Flavobacteriaceae bacterium]